MARKAKKAALHPQDRYWQAVAKGIDAENEKASIFVKHHQSLGVAREAILRNLVITHTPEPFQVKTGFICRLEDDFDISSQCDVLVYNPQIARPYYVIDAFCVVSYEAARSVIEVKTMLTTKSLKEILSVWCSMIKFGAPTFGFAYDGPSFANFVKLLKNSIEGSVLRLPECIAIHHKNYIGYRDQARDGRLPSHFYVLNFGVLGSKVSGNATSHLLGLYDTRLREKKDSYLSMPRVFNLVNLPPECKVRLANDGTVSYGNIPPDEIPWPD